MSVTNCLDAYWLYFTLYTSYATCEWFSIFSYDPSVTHTHLPVEVLIFRVFAISVFTIYVYVYISVYCGLSLLPFNTTPYTILLLPFEDLCSYNRRSANFYVGSTIYRMP